MKNNMSDNTAIQLVHALGGEVINYGEAESQLVFSKTMTSQEIALIMKTNTFLTAYATLLIAIVEESNLPFARKVLDVWMSDSIQEMAQMAFSDDILRAQEKVDKAISKLENLANHHDTE